MRHSALAVLVASIGSAALAAPPGFTQGRLTIDALIEIKHPAQAAWSPDGEQIAFVWDRAGVQNVYVVGSGQGAPRAAQQPGDPALGEPQRLVLAPARHRGGPPGGLLQPGPERGQVLFAARGLARRAEHVGQRPGRCEGHPPDRRDGGSTRCGCGPGRPASGPRPRPWGWTGARRPRATARWRCAGSWPSPPGRRGSP